MLYHIVLNAPIRYELILSRFNSTWCV